MAEPTKRTTDKEAAQDQDQGSQQDREDCARVHAPSITPKKAEPNQWDELNAQWEPFRRGANLHVVPKDARLRAIALPPTAAVQYEPIENPQEGIRA
jgi:hypothetical protein